MFSQVDPSHPEQPARISRIFEALTEQGLLDDDHIVRIPVQPATTKDLLTVHTEDWVTTCIDCAPPTPSDVAEFTRAGAPIPAPPSLGELIFLSQRFDSVFMNQASVECALLSAGATVDVTTQVVQGKCRNGIAVVRPPGHHAEAHCAKGFCFFNK
jgi:histone deacetylase 6